MDWKGQRVVVMGLGRFGGGIGVTRYLATRGAEVVVTDLLPADKLADSINRLADLPVSWHLGGHRMDDFTSCDVVVVSPAVDRRNNPFINAACHAGVQLTSEIRLLVQALPDREHIIGVTGSAGKSTVTAMIGHLLRRLVTDRKVHVGGNLGGSLLDQIDQIDKNDWVVLELSSFMLEDLDEIRFSPHVAVITSLSPNHIDRHGDYQNYLAAKQVILKYQLPHDIACAGPGIRGILPAYDQRIVDFESGDIPDIPLIVPGSHNRLNAYLAALACRAATGCELHEAQRRLHDYPGLPHRLQYVGRLNGVRCFNDSKSTTPEAARLAISSFSSGHVHAILGGYDKCIDLRPLAEHAARHCRVVYTIGDTGEAIYRAARAADGAHADCHACKTLEKAVDLATRHCRHDDVILLTPGCASWDQFDNYEHRGHCFIELLRAHGAVVD